MRDIGEVVLVYYEDKPAVFGRVEAIEPDIKRDWYHLTLQLLTIPTQAVTWILREAYIDGEPFTMGGKAMRIEGVPPLARRTQQPAPEEKEEPEGRGARVIPFRRPEDP